jgi:hypothetical protein
VSFFGSATSGAKPRRASALRRSGVEYHVKVPELLVVGGTYQYFTKHSGDQYRYIQPAYAGRQTLWRVFTRILQAA